jgi:CheY-like chemotaxis protein/putative methionine-R-sulfoxide reductase with GAF domain
MPAIKILHVDDGPDDRQLIRLNIKRFAEDIEIVESESADEALRVLKTQGFDCILCDYQMPGKNGLELLHELRQSGDETPFIFLTGQGNEEIAAAAFGEGADDYFTKEVGFAHYDRLINSIGRVVSDKKHRDEHRIAEQNLLESERRFRALFNLSRRISTDLDFSHVAQSAVEEISKSVQPDLVLLFLRDGDELSLKGKYSKGGEAGNHTMPVHQTGQCLCGVAAQTRHPVYSINIHADNRCTWNDCKSNGFRSFAALPLVWGEKSIGVLGLASYQERDFKKEADFFETIAATVAVAAHNSIMYSRTAKEVDSAGAKDSVAGVPDS